MLLTDQASGCRVAVGTEQRSSGVLLNMEKIGNAWVEKTNSKGNFGVFFQTQSHPLIVIYGANTLYLGPVLPFDTLFVTQSP